MPIFITDGIISSSSMTNVLVFNILVQQKKISAQENTKFALDWYSLVIITGWFKNFLLLSIGQ